MMKSLNRILTIDLIRGYFLFVIIIDHLARYPGVYEIFTGKGWLWTSAAEGFFFVSGMTLGIVRGRKDLEKSFKYVVNKVLKRAGLLYFLTITLCLLFTYLGQFYLGNPNLKFGIETPTSFFGLLGSILTLDYDYGWADFLKYYTILILFSPIAIYLLRKKLWYFVAVISVAIWYFFRLNYFIAAWQILFYSGLVIGFYYNEISDFLTSLTKYLKQISLYLLYSLTFITILISVLQVHFIDMFKNTIWWDLSVRLNENSSYFFDKAVMPFPRLIIFYLWFTALFIFINKFQEKIQKYLGFLVLNFGKNSLYVYVVHSFIVFFLDLYILPFNNIFINLFITTSVISFIWLMVKLKFVFIKYINNLKIMAVSVYKNIILSMLFRTKPYLYLVTLLLSIAILLMI